MASSLTLFTPDNQWKAVFKAFKNSYFVYKSIGSEVTTYHWEKKKTLWWSSWDWVERPVESLSIQNHYAGILPTQVPGVANRSALKRNASYLEEKLWAAGISISITDMGDVSGGGNATLEVRSVGAHISVVINGHELQAFVEER